MSTHRTGTDHPELEELFERYRLAPQGHVFAPLADACRKAGMLEKALEICAKGVATHPRYASGWVVQGKCLFDADRMSDAGDAFRRVLDIDRNNLVALKYLGVIHASRGELDRARDHFEHILALDPDNRDIRLMLAEVRDVPGVAARDIAGPAVAPASPEPVEDVELEEIEDDAFEGEPITLGDESLTSDEIATLTLADIYAAQGYVAKALKIYREVYQRQPGEALRAKIEALESRPSAPVHGDDVAVGPGDGESAEAVLESAEAVLESAGAVLESAAPAARHETGVATHAAPSSPEAHPAPATPRPGSPGDQGRNYEQFKRWLKAMSG